MKTFRKLSLAFAAIIIAADANAGRWLSRDPITEGAGFVQRDPAFAVRFIQRNGPSPYGFVRNEPLRYVDPLGLRIYIMAPPGGGLDYTHFDDHVLNGFQRIIGDCAKLRKSPIIQQVNAGFLFWSHTETRLVGWELSYADEKANCACNPCWKWLKAALGDNIPKKDIYIHRGNMLNNAFENHDNVNINENLNISLPTLDSSGNVVWENTPFDVVLWHEAIGHGYLDLPHPNEPSNSQGGGGVDPTIAEENNARNCLRIQGVVINDRVPTYYGWRKKK